MCGFEMDPDERAYHAQTGFPVVRLGRPVTSDDVRSLEDEE